MIQVTANGNCGYLGLIEILKIEKKMNPSKVEDIRKELQEHAQNNRADFSCGKIYSFNTLSKDLSKNATRFDDMIKPIYQKGKKYTRCKIDHFMIPDDVIPIIFAFQCVAHDGRKGRGNGYHPAGDTIHGVVEGGHHRFHSRASTPSLAWI